MTSLEMAGFSISVLKLSAETATVILNCLDAPCEALGWQHSIHKPSVDKAKVADPLKRTSEERRGGGPANSDQAKMATAKSVDFACEALISCEQMLNTMDSGAGERCGGAQAQLGPRLQSEQRGGGLEGGAPQPEARLLETVGPLPHLAMLSLQGLIIYWLQ